MISIKVVDRVVEVTIDAGPDLTEIGVVIGRVVDVIVGEVVGGVVGAVVRAYDEVGVEKSEADKDGELPIIVENEKLSVEAPDG